MEIKTFIACLICGEKTTAKLCSRPCEIGYDNLFNLEKDLLDLKQSEDRRVFFYDHSMSELCDMYTIALLKYANETGMKRQQLFAKNAQNLFKAIATKINRRHITPELLKSYNNLICDLYEINARMWYERKMALDKTYSEGERSDWALNYLSLDANRTNIKIQIDTFADGISYAGKNYD